MYSERYEFTTIYECGEKLCQFTHKQSFTASAKKIEMMKEAIDNSALLETGRTELIFPIINQRQ